MKVTAVLTATLFAVVLFACSPQGTEPAETAIEQMPSKSESTEKLLAAYERVRSQLANDEAVSAVDFDSLAEAARVASGSYAGDAKGHADQLASSAESAASKAGEGLPEAREAFGEVSRHLIALISAEPELASGRYVFECPMAKSYPKWVQQSESVANPYMGREMATCGSASEWRP
jgi:hypothetical protein